MNTASPFDLEAAMRQWRNALGQSAGCRAENIQELELHLCDSIATLQSKGLSEEEAFLVAVRRLGKPSALDEEFAKVNLAAVWRSRLGWMVAAIGMYLFAMELGKIASTAVLILGEEFSQNGFVIGYEAVAAQCLAIIAAALVFGRLMRFAASPGNRLLRPLLKRPGLAVTLLVVGLLALRLASSTLMAVFIRFTSPSVMGPAFAVSNFYSQLMSLVILAGLVAAGSWLLRSRANLGPGRRVMLVPLALALALGSTGCGEKGATPSTPPGAPAATSSQTSLEQSLALISAGKTNEAVEKFIAADWSREKPFSTGSILSYSEPQFVALPNEAREKVSPELLAKLSDLKALCRRVKDTGDAARARGDIAKAERCTAQLQSCGEALEKPDSLLIVQSIGKAIKKMAAATPGAR